MTTTQQAKTEARAMRLARELSTTLNRLYDDACAADIAAFGRNADAHARRAGLIGPADAAEALVSSLHSVLDTTR